ncbi:uncharacterized protein METZ01_LOCUS273073, partial [marine metagenome]
VPAIQLPYWPPSVRHNTAEHNAYCSLVSVIYAVLSTFSIGLSDFFASGVTKRVRANEVTSTVLLAGVVVMAVAAVFWSGNPTTSDLVHGALAG